MAYLAKMDAKISYLQTSSTIPLLPTLTPLFSQPISQDNKSASSELHHQSQPLNRTVTPLCKLSYPSQQSLQNPQMRGCITCQPHFFDCPPTNGHINPLPHLSNSLFFFTAGTRKAVGVGAKQVREKDHGGELGNKIPDDNQ